MIIRAKNLYEFACLQLIIQNMAESLFYENSFYDTKSIK